MIQARCRLYSHSFPFLLEILQAIIYFFISYNVQIWKLKDTQLLPLLTSSRPLSLSFPFTHTLHWSEFYIYFHQRTDLVDHRKLLIPKWKDFCFVWQWETFFNRFGLSEFAFHKLTAWFDWGSMSRKGNRICTNSSVNQGSSNTNCFITSVSALQFLNSQKSCVRDNCWFSSWSIFFFFLLFCSVNIKPDNWQCLSLLSDY